MTETSTDSAAERLAQSEPLFTEATRLAWRWHGHQTRKGKSTSYLAHLTQVQGLVIEHGGNATQAIAALLHDSLEDADSPAERANREELLAATFEPGVLRIVLDCTDTNTDEAGANKGPWRIRKERYITQLAAAPSESLLVAACDKRHNLGDLIGDLRHEGVRTFARFNAGAAEQLWYFDTLTGLLCPRVPDRLARELTSLMEALRGFVEDRDDSIHDAPQL